MAIFWVSMLDFWGVYHLESRWHNSHVLVYHGHLLVATFWEWRSPSTELKLKFQSRFPVGPWLQRNILDIYAKANRWRVAIYTHYKWKVCRAILRVQHHTHHASWMFRTFDLSNSTDITNITANTIMNIRPWVHPWKLTWNTTLKVWKTICLFNWVIFRFLSPLIFRGVLAGLILLTFWKGFSDHHWIT